MINYSTAFRKNQTLGKKGQRFSAHPVKIQFEDFIGLSMKKILEK